MKLLSLAMLLPYGPDDSHANNIFSAFTNGFLFHTFYGRILYKQKMMKNAL